MRAESYLVNELQLGNTLNKAIELNHRGDFGLLLALMSSDVRDMAQFSLVADDPLEDRLRREFEVSNQQVLVADLTNDEEITDNSQYFSVEGARSFQLHQAIKPEALVIRGPMQVSMADALNNTAPNARIRLSQAESLMPEPLHLADLLTMQRNLNNELAQAGYRQFSKVEQPAV